MHKLLLPAVLLLSLAARAQKNLVYSQYYYLYAKKAVSVVPAVVYEGRRNGYYMVRYNFEADQTLSLSAGKTFALKNGDFSFTPSAGVLAGNANGLSLNMQTSWEKGPFFCSAEPMYCYFTSGSGHYLYNWAEAGWQAGNQFFGGVTLQSTKEAGLYKWSHEPGVFAGFTLGRMELPFYLFHSAHAGAYMVMGLQWRWRSNEAK